MTTSRTNTEQIASTAFVTDGSGVVTQGFRYAPFGEIAEEFTGVGDQYCSNNPVGRVDPSGLFGDEADANKFHQRAVKKYGSERVGDVHNVYNKITK